MKLEEVSLGVRIFYIIYIINNYRIIFQLFYILFFEQFVCNEIIVMVLNSQFYLKLYEVSV